MLRQCAWCGMKMGYSEPFEDRRVTHGICQVCDDRIRLEESQREVGRAAANGSSWSVSPGGAWTADLASPVLAGAPGVCQDVHLSL
jgi:hypothetical protein